MTSSRTRRATSVALVAVALVGLRAAAALGAGPDAVLVGGDLAAGCAEAEVAVGYDVAYVDALAGYGVSAARLSGLDESCRGYDAVVSLTGADGVALAQLTARVDGADLTLTVPDAAAVPAADLTGVSLVLQGAEA